jgi:hypothetical protein
VSDVKKHTPRSSWVSPSSSQALATAGGEPGLAVRLQQLLDAVDDGAPDSDDLACTLFPQLVDVVLAIQQDIDNGEMVGCCSQRLLNALAALAAILPEPKEEM